MNFEKPEANKNSSSQEVFKSKCKQCGGEFTVFFTPTVNSEDNEIALAELDKIKAENLCPNCRK